MHSILTTNSNWSIKIRDGGVNVTFDLLLGYNHTCPNGLFLFTTGLFYKKWDGLKISPIC